ncbi:helix-turn-helix domain-containing protein [Thermoactinomyces sp. DSM 45892]|uniref:helix-turn-helix domain-containing protein n=1 Tax=Thermoactinomyces sp. DSM 45892 TaxID=1882753 RepID=UPI00089C83D7|nr:helix-turn-helix transcriptional regulator [Thermoactinomyces sp. DSM 45892]SDY68723.1 transcriptional regulator [Thermoactinomyces sp. DSM 45892]
MFPSRLQEARKKKGWNQNQLAEKIGKKANTVSTYENGGAMPPVEIVRKLADVLEVSFEWLLGNPSSENGDMYDLISSKGVKWKGKELSPEQLQKAAGILELLLQDETEDKK